MEEKSSHGGKREGAGRPKGINKPYKTVSISLPDGYALKLKQLAFKKDMSISKLLQKLIDDNWID